MIYYIYAQEKCFSFKLLLRVKDRNLLYVAFLCLCVCILQNMPWCVGEYKMFERSCFKSRYKAGLNIEQAAGRESEAISSLSTLSSTSDGPSRAALLWLLQILSSLSG